MDFLSPHDCQDKVLDSAAAWKPALTEAVSTTHVNETDANQKWQVAGINQEAMIRADVQSCGLRYAVFGEHRFCPVSGPLSAIDIARDSLPAESANIDVSHVPRE